MAGANTSAELNRLYWDSDDSVGDIADRFDLSRRALYDVIEPQPTGYACPECGDELVFRNRTARDTGEAECLACDRTLELDDSELGDEAEPTVEQEERATALSPMGRPDGERSGPLLGIALLGGLALGAVLGYLYRSG